jgi:hypothetical protein
VVVKVKMTLSALNMTGPGWILMSAQAATAHDEGGPIVTRTCWQEVLYPNDVSVRSTMYVP